MESTTYKADECFDQARYIYTKLQPESLDYAYALHNQSLVHHIYLKDSQRGESLYREALTIYTRIDPSNRYIPKIRAKLSELASEPTKKSTKSRTVPAGAKNVQTVTEFPKKTFQTIDTIIGTSHTLNTGDMTKAQSCNNHGVLYAQMKQLDDAEECFNQALALYNRRSTQSIGMYFII